MGAMMRIGRRGLHRHVLHVEVTNRESRGTPPVCGASAASMVALDDSAVLEARDRPQTEDPVTLHAVYPLMENATHGMGLSRGTSLRFGKDLTRGAREKIKGRREKPPQSTLHPPDR